jgi:hypothetical protein
VALVFYSDSAVEPELGQYRILALAPTAPASNLVCNMNEFFEMIYTEPLLNLKLFIYTTEIGLNQKK